MKKFTFLMAALLLSFNTLFAIDPQNENVKIYLRNNSLKPKKVALISYTPGIPGNATRIFVLMPLSRKKYEFKVGTKIYLANNKQVDVVMSGRSLLDQPEFLLVKASDDNKSFVIK
ncbi:MAG: hypothetical protein ACOVP1_09375 [Bacteroidia bacterium]